MERLTVDISRDLRQRAWGRYAPLMTEAADKLDDLLVLLGAAETARDEARALLARLVAGVNLPCRLDGAGLCQTHGYGSPCAHAAARELLAAGCSP